MSNQDRINREHHDGTPGDDAPDAAPVPGAATNVSSDDIDSMLDEIDGVLETNSEEFVKGFVQKGGQ